MTQKLSAFDILIKEKAETSSGDISELIYRKCVFCHKLCAISIEEQRIIEKFSGVKKFYCTSCLRNQFHIGNKKDLLIFSFRSVFAYLYANNYCLSQFKKLWLSDIEKCIKDHQEVGLENPLLLYDPENFLWFADFKKIGNSKRKIALSDFLLTIRNILDSIDLKTKTNIDVEILYKKYEKAIKIFHKKRYRPYDREFLIPTLSDTGVNDFENYTFEDMKYFIPCDIKK